MDSDNVFPSPDGTEMLPRDGVEIRKRYRYTSDPIGRKVLCVETAPPDVELGFLFMIIDTAGGRNKIEKAQFMRDRTQLSLSAELAVVYLEPQVDWTFPPPNPDILQVQAFRTGNIDFDTSVFYRTVNGTAIAGTDYTANSGTYTFAAGNNASDNTVNFIVNPATGSGKYFTIELYNPGPRTTISDGSFDGVSTGIMVVNLI
jgi:hypothetical protein